MHKLNFYDFFINQICTKKCSYLHFLHIIIFEIHFLDILTSIKIFGGKVTKTLSKKIDIKNFKFGLIKRNGSTISTNNYFDLPIYFS